MEADKNLGLQSKCAEKRKLVREKKSRRQNKQPTLYVQQGDKKKHFGEELLAPDLRKE